MNSLAQFLSAAAKRQDMVLALLIMMAIFMMILPLPTELIDVLIAINLTLSILLLMIALYIQEPLDISVYPSLLLITTLFRLALTVSTSRLILLQHDAGEIVYAFGNFVVGGNIVVGIIVFAIITTVQFIVITKGSERVAEVSARFSLDAMPGKQMSIDGDVRSGVITLEQAREQRTKLQKESQLYGAMDGAMKFVKGDAIASIIVIFVNIIGGMTIGILQHGMSAGQAGETYTILSVGDGLVAQIPALLISIASGIIVTRVPSEEKRNLGSELAGQVGAQPNALLVSGVIICVFAFIPGLPFFDFIIIASIILSCTWFIKRTRFQEQHTQQGSKIPNDRKMKPGAEPLMMRLSSGLFSGQELVQRIDELRWDKFQTLGVSFPEVSIRFENNIPENTVEVYLYQTPVDTLTLAPHDVMIMAALETVNLPGRDARIIQDRYALSFLAPEHQDYLEENNYTCYTGIEQMMQYLSLFFDFYARDFIGIQETHYLMDSMEQRYSELVKEVQRVLSLHKVSEVFQRLLAEKIAIRDLRSIFEALIEWTPKEKDIVLLTEYVRISLRRQIVHQYRDPNNIIRAYLIGEQLEGLIRDSIRQTSAGSYSALEPAQKQEIFDLIQSYTHDINWDQYPPVLVTTVDVRRYLRKIIETDLFPLMVLSYQELGDEAKLDVLGTINIAYESSMHPPLSNDAPNNEAPSDAPA